MEGQRSSPNSEINRQPPLDNDNVEATSTKVFKLHSAKWHTVKKSAQRKFVSAVDRIISLSRRDSSATHIQRFLSDPSELPYVTLGPVIGKVTQNSARILLEIGKPGGPVCMLLEPLEERQTRDTAKTSNGNRHPGTQSMSNGNAKGPGERVEVQNTLEADRPTIFVFENLQPGCEYRIKLKGCILTQQSSFRTFPVDISEANFAVISCNKIFVTDKEIPAHSDLWVHLSKAIDLGKISMCLHLGDQIYGDGDKMLDAEAGKEPGDWTDRFKKSKAKLEKLPKDQWNQHQETVCEYYRTVYRKTWSHPYTAFCLANCPNLMVYDDHEVRDNWGDLPGDWDKKSVDFFIARCAWIVNLEYQRQLHEDVDFDKLDLIDRDYHFHLISGVGIAFLDIRGSRTFHRVENDEKRYLGSRQWQDFKTALDKGGLFDSARVLLLCTPAPLVFLDHNLTDACANRVRHLEDFKGHWSAAPHFAEQKQMIDCLCEWKLKASSSDRVVLILGGDVHCGGHSDILRERKVVFRQLTTSAIANHPLPKSAYYMLRAAGRLRGVGQDFAFRHHDWTRSRNYGLVNIKYDGPEATTKPEVTSQLIKGKFMVGFREGVKVSNLEEGSRARHRCCAFHEI